MHFWIEQIEWLTQKSFLSMVRGSDWLIFTVKVAAWLSLLWRRYFVVVNARHSLATFQKSSETRDWAFCSQERTTFLFCRIFIVMYFFFHSHSFQSSPLSPSFLLPVHVPLQWKRAFWRSEILWKSSWFCALKHHHKNDVAFFTAKIWLTRDWRAFVHWIISWKMTQSTTFFLRIQLGSFKVL